jgi:hypothetical protein
MYNCVLLVPGVVIVIGFDVTGFPFPTGFPFSSGPPILLNGAGLQLAGWHCAVISAVPGKLGVTIPAELTGIVVGVVEMYSSVKPVRGFPFVSSTVVVSGWGLFWFTEILEPPRCGIVNWMLAGGHVEKKPAELPAFDKVEVIVVDPGACAVATPFSSTVTIAGVCGV